MFILPILFLIGNVNALQNCPEHKPIENFDWDFFASKYWYEVEKYDNGWEEDQECLAAYFDKVGDVHTFNVTGIKNHEPFYNTGFIKHSPENFATMDLYSKQYTDNLGTDFIQVNITFFTKRIAVAHHCVVTENGLQEFAWLLSLQSILNGEARKEADQYFNTGTFDRSKFTAVNHVDCYNYS